MLRSRFLEPSVGPRQQFSQAIVRSPIPRVGRTIDSFNRRLESLITISGKREWTGIARDGEASTSRARASGEMRMSRTTLMLPGLVWMLTCSGRAERTPVVEAYISTMPARTPRPADSNTQSERFIEIARVLERDEDETEFRAKLAVIGRQKPEPNQNWRNGIK